MEKIKFLFPILLVLGLCAQVFAQADYNDFKENRVLFELTKSSNIEASKYIDYEWKSKKVLFLGIPYSNQNIQSALMYETSINSSSNYELKMVFDFEDYKNSSKGYDMAGLTIGHKSKYYNYQFIISRDGYCKVLSHDALQFTDMRWTPFSKAGISVTNELVLRFCKKRWYFFVNGTLVHSMDAKKLKGKKMGALLGYKSGINIKKFTYSKIQVNNDGQRDIDHDGGNDIIAEIEYEEEPYESNQNEEYDDSDYGNEDIAEEAEIEMPEPIEEEWTDRSVNNNKGVLHAILIGATDELDIEDNAENTLAGISEELEVVEKNTGLKVKRYYCKGKNFTKSNVIKQVKNLKVNKNDVIWLYYFGHGFRYKSQKGDFPYMFMGYMDDEGVSPHKVGLDSKKVYDQLRKRNARLTLVTVELCNTVLTTVDIPSVDNQDFMGMQNNSSVRKNYRELFLYTSGGILACSSSPGQKSWSSPSGGYFYNKLLGNIKESVSSFSGKPSWDKILKNTQKEVHTESLANDRDARREAQRRGREHKEKDSRVQKPLYIIER